MQNRVGSHRPTGVSSTRARPIHAQPSVPEAPRVVTRQSSRPIFQDGFDAAPRRVASKLTGEASLARRAGRADSVNQPPTPLPPATYTVKAGDTGTSIAAALGVSIQALRAANPDAAGLVSGSGAYLQIGQVLNVPPPPPPPLARAPRGAADLTPSQAMVDAARVKREQAGVGTDAERRYDGRCLELVADTVVAAQGTLDPILSQGNAAAALDQALREGRVYADFSQMPAGAIVFWEATGANRHQGHIAIFTGRFDENDDPILMTSTGFGADPSAPAMSGVRELTLSRLNGLEDVEAAGWMMPRAAQPESVG